MKTTELNKKSHKTKMGEYSSIEELVSVKSKRASETLKNIDLTKIILAANKES